MTDNPYKIEVERIRTWQRFLYWSAQVTGKKWRVATDWRLFTLRSPQPQRAAGDDLGEQHLDVGLAGGEPCLDVALEWCTHDLLRHKTHKKSGPAPTSGTSPGKRPAHKLRKLRVALQKRRSGAKRAPGSVY